MTIAVVAEASVTIAVVAEAPAMIAEVVGKLARVVGVSVGIAALRLVDDLQVYPESEIVFPL